MPFLVRIAKPALMAAIVALTAGAPAFAIDALDRADQTRIIQQGGAADLQALQNRLQRQQFQQQQQIFREQDRQAQPQQPPRVQVPRVGQNNCQTSGFGNSAVSGCR